MLGVVLLLWAFRKELGRGPLVGVLFFCGTLSPAIGFFDVFPFRVSEALHHCRCKVERVRGTYPLAVLAGREAVPDASEITASQPSIAEITWP